MLFTSFSTHAKKKAYNLSPNVSKEQKIFFESEKPDKTS